MSKVMTMTFEHPDLSLNTVYMGGEMAPLLRALTLSEGSG